MDRKNYQMGIRFPHGIIWSHPKTIFEMGFSTRVSLLLI